MAFDDTPTTWIPSWSEDGTDITVPIASFPELTAAEADAATGDIRKILFAVLTRIYAVWAALSLDDRPGKMRITRSDDMDDASGQMTRTFAVRFHLSGTSQDVADE